jgi:hypothetical protein
MSDPRSPIDDVAAIAKKINDLQDQVNALKNPSGTSAFQTVKKLQGLIDNIQAQLDNYIANGTYNKIAIDARIASPPYDVFGLGKLGAAGDGYFGGNLRVVGGVNAPSLYSNVVTTGRKGLWIDSSGNVGVSA